ncbi:hypothetical protein [Calycomorphotria hydatis]|uniref:Uncharacterized protein n=1 Tax=Calycomorphotria hydatis TaxID=2528027 RepID=A0A517T3A2_9PLAN|nr:hypothetical protein [Calycomorphotria hydatis]QDT62850.1 hypothetical protein V22_00480 [Calycomorphotria hydatis]
MLTISNDTLPQTCLSYLAFRIAFKETLERIALSDQMGGDPHDKFGFLTEVPFLASVPAHVQIDLLGATWAKHLSQESQPADLVDEAVIYSVCETSARIVEQEPDTVHNYLAGGPLDVTVPVDHFLATELRALHLNLSNEGDFLLISQFEDMEPEEAKRLKQKFGLDEERTEALFEVLKRYHLSADFLGNLTGMLTGREILTVVKILGVK